MRYGSSGLEDELRNARMRVKIKGSSVNFPNSFTFVHLITFILFDPDFPFLDYHTVMASQVDHQKPLFPATTPPAQQAKTLETDTVPSSSHSSALKTDTTTKLQDPSAPVSPTLPTPIHPTIPPSDNDYTSTGTTKSRSRSRRRRPRRRLNSSTESTPPLPFRKEINTTIPSGSSSSTFELPYHPALQQFRPGKGPHDPTTNSNTNALAASPTAPQAEHPIQVPVRVVNPSDILPSSDSNQKAGNGGAGGGNLRLRLDLNLDVEVTLKATIRGDLTLALL